MIYSYFVNSIDDVYCQCVNKCQKKKILTFYQNTCCCRHPHNRGIQQWRSDIGGDLLPGDKYLVLPEESPITSCVPCPTWEHSLWWGHLSDQKCDNRRLGSDTQTHQRQRLELCLDRAGRDNTDWWWSLWQQQQDNIRDGQIWRGSGADLWSQI